MIPEMQKQHISASFRQVFEGPPEQLLIKSQVIFLLEFRMNDLVMLIRVKRDVPFTLPGSIQPTVLADGVKQRFDAAC